MRLPRKKLCIGIYTVVKGRIFPQGKKCPHLLAGMTSGNLTILYKNLSGFSSTCFHVNERKNGGREKKDNLNNELLTKIKQNNFKSSAVNFKNQKFTHQPQYALWLLLANLFLHYQRNNCMKILTGYYSDEDGMTHFVYSTKLVVVLILMSVSRKMFVG